MPNFDPLSLSHCLGVNNPTSGWHPVSTGYCTTWDAVETWEKLQTTRIWHDTIGTNTSSIVCFLSFTTSSCHQIVIRSKRHVVVQQGPPMAAGRQTRTPWHAGGERGRTMKPGDDPCVVFDVWYEIYQLSNLVHSLIIELNGPCSTVSIANPIKSPDRTCSH